MDMQAYSDLHKDVFGFRPKTVVQFGSESDYAAKMQQLQNILQDDMDAQLLRDKNAFELVKAEIETMKANGAESNSQAFDWLCDANGVTQHNLRQAAVEIIHCTYYIESPDYQQILLDLISE